MKLSGRFVDLDIQISLITKERTKMTRDEFAASVTANEKKLYIAALSVVRNTEDAKDAVAAAVAHAWEKLDTLKDEAKFDGWLLRITYNEAKKLRRHANEYVSLSEIGDSFSRDADYSSLQFFDLISSARLDGKSSRILMLRFFYGYDLAETAKLMDIPESTVKTKYYRALDKIRNLLK